MNEESHSHFPAFSRREFLAAAGALAVMPALGQRGPKIKLGLIGCGNRGSWIAGLFKSHGGFEITACADYFPDRAATFGNFYGVPEGRRFTTLSAYKRLLDLGDVDAVAIETPCYFHPEQAAAAAEAGKHIYLAKPVAVDIPGCQTVAEAGRKATAKGRVFLVDFQTRSTPFYQEAIRRVHAGALGQLCYGNAFYHSSELALGGGVREQLAAARAAVGVRAVKTKDAPAEFRLRHWNIDARLSGNFIVEQDVHTLDVMNWVMLHPPQFCVGTGSRKGRNDPGDCWGYYACYYQYPENVGITFSGKQYPVEGADEGIIVNIYGERGALLTNYGGETMIRAGKEGFYRGGKTPDIYVSGVVNNIAEFHRLIAAKDCANAVVEAAAQSTAIAVMGREAALKQQVVTWEELQNKGEKIDAGLEGLKA